VISVTVWKIAPFIIDRVGKLRKAVYLAMAIMLLSVPLLACSVPWLTMSEEEQECCRQMSEMCGDMQMNQSHSCCTKEPTLATASLQPTAKFTAPLPDLAYYLAPTPLLPQSAAWADSLDVSAERWSKSPPSHTSVLRI
jgi:hypothetical protein